MYVFAKYLANVNALHFRGGIYRVITLHYRSHCHATRPSHLHDITFALA